VAVKSEVVKPNEENINETKSNDKEQAKEDIKPVKDHKLEFKVKQIQSHSSSKPAKSSSCFIPKFETPTKKEENSGKNRLSLDSFPMEKEPNLNNTSNKLQNNNLSNFSVIKDQIFNEDGNVDMYWIDAYERDGIIYLFGKVCKEFLFLIISIKIYILLFYFYFFVFFLLIQPFMTQYDTAGFALF